MVVQNQVAGARSILPRPSCERGGMRPEGLNTLSVRHSYAIHVVKVEFCLTRRSVANDVEFRDRDTEGVEGIDIKWGNGDVF